MPDREKVIDGLERLRFFNQRAGRELWADKPHDVQEKDIANADAVYADALALLKEQETVEHALEVLRKAGWKETHDVPFPVELLKEQEAITIKKTKEPYGYGVYGGICPKCRNWIQSAHSFCGFCGQAVKWE